MRMVWRIVKWTLLALLLVVLALAAWIGPVAYPGLHPGHDHDTVAPVLPAKFDHPAILVFSKTNGFRHDKAIAAANALFAELARAHGWSVFTTENGAVHNPGLLSRFRVVVWSNASGDVLTADQRQSLRAFIENGGGFIGIHAAGDNSHADWPWYQDELIGARFVGHTLWPHAPLATVRIEPGPHAVTAGLPATLRREDEWYSFDRSVRKRGYRVLATVDEASYDLSGRFSAKLRMGADHPMIWTHCVGRGRALYSALGHGGEAYAEPAMRLLLGNALEWAMRPQPCDAATGD